MRVVAGVAVALGVLAAPVLASAADIYLLRDRQGVLHLTNAPVDPGSKLVIRQPPKVPFPRVLTLEPMGPRLPPLVVPDCVESPCGRGLVAPLPASVHSKWIVALPLSVPRPLRPR